MLYEVITSSKGGVQADIINRQIKIIPIRKAKCIVLMSSPVVIPGGR